MKPRTPVLALLLLTGLACMGTDGSSGGPAAVAAPAGGFGDVAYKRFKNLDEVETLDFVSTEKVTIFYAGRYDDRKPLVGTWKQDGAEIALDLDPVKGQSGPHIARIRLRQLGHCSIALYRREKTDGSHWASGQLLDDGMNLAQPVLYEQKWPPCEHR
ncbi:MAG: hypothetical protein H6736_11075 [Alphaproteobacteria bacterium]|nr:hypothetical protein [Alphaproteobacteria bacterium]MCB9692346.1 hypothetical protein [Alphaproteobacteria bacterium]